MLQKPARAIGRTLVEVDVLTSSRSPHVTALELCSAEANGSRVGEGNGGEHHGEHGEHLARPAVKKVFGSKELVERAIGIEPTTFSLGSLRRSLIFLTGVPHSWPATERHLRPQLRLRATPLGW